MIIHFHRTFHKQAQKLKPAQKKRLQQALLLFVEDLKHPRLYNHALTGKWKGHYSISFGGDWRAHYIKKGKSMVLFVAVGTHNQLYK